MNRTGALFFLFLLFLAAAVGYKHFTTPASALRPLPPDATLLAFGDSLTYGTGARWEESYPARLERRIGRRVINAGVPGELSAEGLKRLDGLLETHRPALLLLCHGGNDILKKQEAPLHSNLEGMIEMAQRRGIDVVLIAVPQFSLIGLDPHPVYEEVAKSRGVLLEEEILSELLGDNRTKSDYIHPNAQGYDKMAEAVEKIIRGNFRVEE